MTAFTSQDRERAQKTLTLIEQHVKVSDERHDDVREILQDHENRIRKGEGFRAKVIGWAVGAGIFSVGTAEFIKTKFGL